jgi:hypothetical protein
MQFSRAARLIVVGLSAVGLAAAAVLPASADASSWKLGYYTPSTHGALSMSDAKPGDGLASFAFTDQANTALLVTSHGASKGTSLGDLTNRTITATYTISGATNGSFTSFGAGTPANPCSTPANVRLYFETDNGGGFQFTHFWWSDTAFESLGDGTVTLTATVQATGWSDWNGQPSETQGAGFADAASNVTTIGLSFGGGCFFANGVGTTDGSGTFTLDTFNVS